MRWFSRLERARCCQKWRGKLGHRVEVHMTKIVCTGGIEIVNASLDKPRVTRPEDRIRVRPEDCIRVTPEDGDEPVSRFGTWVASR